MSPKIHELKCWPTFFDAIDKGKKTFEVRKNDRDFQVRDILILQEWDPVEERYSGRLIFVEVVYILEGGQMGIEAGFVCMAIKRKL